MIKSILVFIICLYSPLSQSAMAKDMDLTVAEIVSDPGIVDTLRLESGAFSQGSQLVLAVHFFCDEDLGGIQIILDFDKSELLCDSISFANSSVALGIHLVTIDSLNGTISAVVIYVGESVILPQAGLFGEIYFSQMSEPHGATYTFDSTSIQVDSVITLRTIFSATNPATSIFPEFVAGTIVVANFVSGDANNDNKISIGDVTFLITHIFAGGPAPVNPAAADVNASCSISIGDVTYLIAHIFTGGAAPLLGCAP